jgi:SSS family solute:Na+ symporter
MFILLPMVLYTGARFMQSMFQPDLSIMAIAILFALAGLAYAALGGLRANRDFRHLHGSGAASDGGLVTVFALERDRLGLLRHSAERLTFGAHRIRHSRCPTLFTGMVFAHIFYWGTNMVIAQRALGAPGHPRGAEGHLRARRCSSS